MIYTIDNILANPVFMNVVINRALVTLTDQDRIDWPDYLDPLPTNPDGTFKTFSGNQTAVIIGSFIDKNANKPVRKRHAMAKGQGEVGSLGEAYQMDNDRLDRLQELVETLNRLGRQEDMEAVVNFLVDDFRQCALAPHKRMDLMLNDLKFSGQASVRSKADENGVKINTITLPFKTGKNKLVPVAGNKSTFISYLINAIPTLRLAGCDATIMEMNRFTFTKCILGCQEFKDNFLTKVANFEVGHSISLISPNIVNDVFASLQIPYRIKLKEVYINMQDGSAINAVPNYKISLLPGEKIGNLRHHTPYELKDRIPGKAYTEQDYGMFIATERTKEGRFMEYGCDWIVDINRSNRMGLIDCSAFE
ncbi:MAG: hypothetical protein II874_04100 [Bacteroidales bacterium]|nr:hypothetical protein [Bacteroidales bacterium]